MTDTKQDESGNKKEDENERELFVRNDRSTIAYQFNFAKFSYSGPEFHRAADESAPGAGAASAAPTGAAPTSAESPKPESQYKFDDPTLPFPVRTTAPVYVFDPAQIEQWGQRVMEGRVIAVRSPDDGLTAAAVDALLDLPSLRSCDRRLLAFGAKNQQRLDLSLENLAAHLPVDAGATTVLVVDAHGALPFVQSMYNGVVWTRAMTEALRARRLAIIVQLATIDQRTFRASRNFHFECWAVDFLAPLIGRCHSAAVTASLIERLTAQRKAGRWGQQDDDLHLFELLQQLLAQGCEALEAALDARDQRDTSEPEVAAPEASVPIKAFGMGSQVLQGVLVCAAFFRDVDVTEFGQIVCAVSGQEEVLFEEVIHTTDARARRVERRALLRDVWPRVADRMLDACGLVVDSSGTRNAVTFVRLEARRVLLAHIQRRAAVYMGDVSERLWESRLLFAPGSSPELVEGLIEVFGATLGSRQHWKRPEWLFDTLRAVLRTVDGGRADDLASLLRKEAVVLARLTRLLGTLLDRDDTASLIDRWLGYFMSQGQPLVALTLVSHLRHARGVDFLHWLKRLADEGTTEVCQAVYVALYGLARQSEIGIGEVFTRVHTWLPKAERRGSMLSNSNKLALQLLVEYAVDSAESLAPEDYGAWPSRYPLFRAMALQAEGPPLTNVLVPWLFHDALDVVFTPRDSTMVWMVRAKVLRLWSCILLGAAEPHPAAERVYHEIIEASGALTTAADRNILIRTWHAQRTASAGRSAASRGVGMGSRLLEISQRLEWDFRQLAPAGSVR